jgi:recombination protein RecT
MGKELERALPRHISADRMMRIATTALRANPDLAKCSQVSFLGCVLSAAQLGLEVNTPLGQAYLIPRKNKNNGMECTLQIGYQGFMDLARRSGEVAAIYAEAVYQGDAFSYELGLEKKLSHKPGEDPAREDGPLTHVYAVAKLKSGEALFVVLTRSQVEKYRKRGGDRSFSPWATDYEAMAKKTAVRRLFTWMPKSAEIAGAVAIDEAPELGKPQVAVFDTSVTAALEARGIEVVTPAEEETGEVPMREPGED